MIVRFIAASGKTLTVSVYGRSTGTLVGSYSASAVSGPSTLYSVDVGSLADGEYIVEAVDGTYRASEFWRVRNSAVFQSDFWPNTDYINTAIDLIALNTQLAVASVFPSQAPSNWIQPGSIASNAITAAKIATDALDGKGDWATSADVEINVTPLTGVVESGVSGTNIATYTGESKTVAIAVVDATGASVDLTGLTLSVVIEKYESQSDVATVEDADIDVSGSTVTFTIPSEVTETVGDKPWSLWTSGNVLLLRGIISVQYTPKQST